MVMVMNCLKTGSRTEPLRYRLGIGNTFHFIVFCCMAGVKSLSFKILLTAQTKPFLDDDMWLFSKSLGEKDVWTRPSEGTRSPPAKLALLRRLSAEEHLPLAQSVTTLSTTLSVTGISLLNLNAELLSGGV